MRILFQSLQSLNNSVREGRQQILCWNRCKVSSWTNSVEKGRHVVPRKHVVPKWKCQHNWRSRISILTTHLRQSLLMLPEGVTVANPNLCQRLKVTCKCFGQHRVKYWAIQYKPTCPSERILGPCNTLYLFSYTFLLTSAHAYSSTFLILGTTE